MPHYVIVDKDLLDPDDDSSIAMHEALQLRSDRGRDHHARVKFTETLTRTNMRLYLYEVRLVSVGDGTMFERLRKERLEAQVTGEHPKTKKAPSRSSGPSKRTRRRAR